MGMANRSIHWKQNCAEKKTKNVHVNFKHPALWKRKLNCVITYVGKPAVNCLGHVTVCRVVSYRLGAPICRYSCKHSCILAAADVIWFVDLWCILCCLNRRPMRRCNAAGYSSRAVRLKTARDRRRPQEMAKPLGRVAIQDRLRPVAWAASVIGWETRPVLILATGLGFATRPRKHHRRPMVSARDRKMPQMTVRAHTRKTAQDERSRKTA